MEAEVYYSKMDADEIRWSREDDNMGYYPRRNDSDGYAIHTPWRVRKIVDEKGYIAGWVVSKQIKVTDDDGNVTETRFEGERYLDKAEEAKRVAEQFICDDVNAERKERAEQEAVDIAAEVALAEPTVAAIKTWIKDNLENIVEAGLQVQFNYEDVDLDMTAQSIDSDGWRKWSDQHVQFNAPDDDGDYRYRQVYVTIPHPAGSDWGWMEDGSRGQVFSSCEMNMTSLNGNVEEYERRAKAMELAVSLSRYCDDVNNMVREQEKISVND